MYSYKQYYSCDVLSCPPGKGFINENLYDISDTSFKIIDIWILNYFANEHVNNVFTKENLWKIGQYK